mmetsp:Transcript_25306/g.88328  ORF Transcript_25306/g.88328 Transcript_25306/m.88328 type:complete len:248 (-) Transcript_25306:535-1278(-)
MRLGLPGPQLRSGWGHVRVQRRLREVGADRDAPWRGESRVRGRLHVRGEQVRRQLHFRQVRVQRRVRVRRLPSEGRGLVQERGGRRAVRGEHRLQARGRRGDGWILLEARRRGHRPLHLLRRLLVPALRHRGRAVARAAVPGVRPEERAWRRTVQRQRGLRAVQDGHGRHVPRERLLRVLLRVLLPDVQHAGGGGRGASRVHAAARRLCDVRRARRVRPRRLHGGPEWAGDGRQGVCLQRRVGVRPL